MPGKIALEPGPPNALWNSDGIRLRSQQETNPQNIGPHIDPQIGSSYYTYVKVTNTDPTVYPPSPVPAPAWTVYLRRVRVTTIPNQIDYTDMGQSSVYLDAGQSLWTEFPPSQPIIPVGSTPGQMHYCLRAMGDASPSDPAPGWDSLNLNDPHFAQRNLVFA